MFRSNRRHIALLALFAFALVSMQTPTYVRADEVEVAEKAINKEADSVDEVIDIDVDNAEQKVEEAQESVEDNKTEEEAADSVVVESETVEDVKEDPQEEQSSKSAVDFAEKGNEFISKVKNAIQSADLDAKKIAAFGLGAWGTATGIGWAMEKIGGKKED